MRTGEAPAMTNRPVAVRREHVAQLLLIAESPDGRREGNLVAEQLRTRYSCPLCRCSTTRSAGERIGVASRPLGGRTGRSENCTRPISRQRFNRNTDIEVVAAAAGEVLELPAVPSSEIELEAQRLEPSRSPVHFLRLARSGACGLPCEGSGMEY